MVGLLLEGSSTCRPFADEVTVEDGVLHVSIMEPEETCTRDRVLQGLAVGLPAGVDSAQDLRVEVEGAGINGETDLEGVAGRQPGGGLDHGPPMAGGAVAQRGRFPTRGPATRPPQA